MKGTGPRICETVPFRLLWYHSGNLAVYTELSSVEHLHGTLSFRKEAQSPKNKDAPIAKAVACC